MSSMPRRATVVGFFLGSVIGFVAGALSTRGAVDFVLGLFEAERPADVAHPVTVRRPSFTFQHAANWTLDVADADYDPDRRFSVESPGSTFAMFIIADAELDPAETVEKFVAVQTAKVLRDAKRTPLLRWGSYDGVGVMLRGKTLGIAPGSMRIFAWLSGGRTYTLIESTYDDDQQLVQPGLALIERTFHVADEPPGDAPPP